MTFTYFETAHEPSPLDKVFWGRVPIQKTYALLYFEQDKPSQKILHALKYQNKANLGIFMGHIIGKKLKENNLKLDDFFNQSISNPIVPIEKLIVTTEPLTEVKAKRQKAFFG